MRHKLKQLAAVAQALIRTKERSTPTHGLSSDSFHDVIPGINATSVSHTHPLIHHLHEEEEHQHTGKPAVKKKSAGAKAKSAKSAPANKPVRKASPSAAATKKAAPPPRKAAAGLPKAKPAAAKSARAEKTPAKAKARPKAGK